MCFLIKRRAKKTGERTDCRLPRHIAIIMDGNGRWAKKRALPRSAGHSAGAENFRKVATYCKDIGIEYLTVYAFSTENWKRPDDEVSGIMSLLEKYLHESIEKMERDRVRMRFLGDKSILSPRLQALIKKTEDISSRYEGCQVNICLNYGARDEILRAAASMAADSVSGKAVRFNDEEFSKRLFSAGIPDPELIIRPGGEMRLSNFLLWQAAYSELYFSDILWPDFGTDEIDKAIAWFSKRARRFGGVDDAD